MFKKGDVVPEGLSPFFYQEADYEPVYTGALGLHVILQNPDETWPDNISTPKLFSQPDERLKLMFTQCLKALGYADPDPQWLGTYSGDQGVFNQDVTEDRVVEMLQNKRVTEDELVLLEEKYPDLSRRLKVVDKIYGAALDA